MDDTESDRIDKSLRRARGAASNRDGRFERHARLAFHDGWGLAEETRPPLRTEVAMERARTILARNESPDLSFDRSVNPYRGCEHGCVYCFARPSHAFLGLSPGLDFETRLTAKPNAAERLAAELSRKAYVCAPIAIGTNTDPYQPVEKRLGITRAILGVLREFNHPVSVLTKGALVTRDADILGEMGRAGLARAGLSLTTLDPALARAMEPRAAAPATRLAAIEALAAAGCPVWVSLGPVIPGLNDMEMERLLAAAKAAGARGAGYIVLRLPREVGPIFRDWLEESFPDRAARVMNLVRQIHGGRDYDPEWGKRMTGEGPIAALIARRFAVASRRLGLDRPWPPLRRDLFRPPRRGPEQLSLF
ncbi:PA0069 family radical SAM protein [Amaricoccus solimangrovi]|uniref:PA0069 family radical SAM protein n=1 Tax=Amaricoccus solimangrovi TaxID=2589815 RepID=A0A501WZ81_9RHOB|nr:PA0069 family radical SAM protein [Amaricoccus solimangrovi]TPE51366.1 PA0069 family radical SAM protein [Amaricoccus solimangrovi]